MFEALKEHKDQLEKAGDMLAEELEMNWMAGKKAEKDPDFLVDNNNIDLEKSKETERAVVETKKELSELEEQLALNQSIAEEVAQGNFSNIHMLTRLNDQILNALILSSPNIRKYQETRENIEQAEITGNEWALDIYETILANKKEQGFYLEEWILDLSWLTMIRPRQANKLSMILNVKEIRLDWLEELSPELAQNLIYSQASKVSLTGVNMETVDQEVIKIFLNDKDPNMEIAFGGWKLMTETELSWLAAR